MICLENRNPFAIESPKFSGEGLVRGRRAGFTLAELMVALILIGAATGITLPLIAAQSRVRLNLERRRMALAEAENLLERMSGIPYARLTPELVRELKLSAAAQQALPSGEAHCQVVEETTAPLGKRLEVEIRWDAGPGKKSPPCRLVTWVYALPGARP